MRSVPIDTSFWDDDEALKSHLIALQQEHRDLDSAINALVGAASSDQLQVRRLKKKKLMLKDQIGAVEDRLMPDIIA